MTRFLAPVLFPSGSPEPQLPLAGKVGRRYTSPRFSIGVGSRCGGTASRSNANVSPLQGGMSVERLLIVGIDTVVGANLAAQLADQFHVTGLSTGEEIAIEGCVTTLAPISDAPSARQAIALYRPDRLVLCQAAGDSSWHSAGSANVRLAADATRAWIEAARTAGKFLTLISTDAVFTGPWMFHGETCDSFCQASEAQSLRTLEMAALQDSAHSLVVRTHPYGWSPQLDGGWIDGILAALEADQPPVFDSVAHATPILATDLADVLSSAWSRLDRPLSRGGSRADQSAQFRVCGGAGLRT